MESFFIGFVLGIVLTAVIIRVVLHLAVKRAEHTIQALEHAIEKLNESTVPARVEQHQGVFYVYDTRDDSFIVQGSTLDEIREHLQDRWQDRNIVVTEGDPEVLDALKVSGTR